MRQRIKEIGDELYALGPKFDVDKSPDAARLYGLLEELFSFGASFPIMAAETATKVYADYHTVLTDPASTDEEYTLAVVRRMFQEQNLLLRLVNIPSFDRYASVIRAVLGRP